MRAMTRSVVIVAQHLPLSVCDDLYVVNLVSSSKYVLCCASKSAGDKLELFCGKGYPVKEETLETDAIFVVEFVRP